VAGRPRRGSEHQEEARGGREGASCGDPVKERRRHFLAQRVTGKALSDSTVGRPLRRMGFSREKTERRGGAGTRRVAEGGLWRAMGSRRGRSRRSGSSTSTRWGRTSHCVRGARVVAPRGAGVLLGAPQQPREEHHPSLQHERGGHGAFFSGGGGGDHRHGLRGLRREGARTDRPCAAGADDRGDGRPLGPQGSSRPGARSSKGEAASCCTCCRPIPPTC
jgi:hypothetical protein